MATEVVRFLHLLRATDEVDQRATQILDRYRSMKRAEPKGEAKVRNTPPDSSDPPLQPALPGDQPALPGDHTNRTE